MWICDIVGEAYGHLVHVHRGYPQEEIYAHTPLMQDQRAGVVPDSKVWTDVSTIAGMCAGR